MAEALEVLSQGAAAASWTDGMRVEERKLQEYLCQKQHTVLLRGAAQAMKHTLEPLQTTAPEDGLLHFGDTVMLLSRRTQGLLQADIAGLVAIADASRATSAAPQGAVLSTGSTVMSCPRNTFIVSRVRDDDGFGQDSCVHYGQSFRLSTLHDLQEPPLYLYASGAGASDQALEDGETLVCLYQRAAAQTHWRAVLAEEEPPARGAGRSKPPSPATAAPVPLRAPLQLESVTNGRSLRSDRTVRMTTYGNEWRVFGEAASSAGAPSAAAAPEDAVWSFVNTPWAEEQVEAARQGGQAAALASASSAGVVGVVDPSRVDAGELLRDPVYRAEQELQLLEDEGGAKAFKVLEHVYPILRAGGMHSVRRLRRNCINADVQGRGRLPLRAFQGVLAGLGARLQASELAQLAGLFEAPAGSGDVEYMRFIQLMAPTMPQVRTEVVQDAYQKLKSLAPGGFVEVCHIQRNWNPRSHPEVQSGSISASEAKEDFLRQWDVASADGTVSYDEFAEYYQDVSIAVQSDELFVELVRSGWGL